MNEHPTYDELPQIMAALMPNVTPIGEGATRTWTFEPAPADLDLHWSEDHPSISQELAERIALARILAVLEVAGFHEAGPA